MKHTFCNFIPVMENNLVSQNDRYDQMKKFAVGEKLFF